MQENKEIVALLHLMDDPDAEVFDSVANRLLHYGKDIIPNLEALWEVTVDEDVQNRIENLIHRANFTELQSELASWGEDPMPPLFKGALLLARYRYPELSITQYQRLLDQMRRNIWLELNAYLTPLEQINVVNGILYNYYKLEGREITERDINQYYLNQALDNKKGNAYSIGILYLTLCELLDIPIFAVNIPRQFVLAFFDTQYHFYSPGTRPVQSIQFYIDPVNGMVYTQNDVDVYLKKLNINKEEEYFKPLNNNEVMLRMLEEMEQTYQYGNEYGKANDMQHLAAVLKSNK
ncbi:MAG: transglutaminase family protein [Edaphocola sp.]